MLSKINQELLLYIIEFHHVDKTRLQSLVRQNNIDWIELMGFISFNRLSGLVYNVLSKNEVVMPTQVRYETSHMRNIQFLRQKKLTDEIAKISNKLQKEKLSHVFLKGSVLSSTVYEPGSRSSNDIDILVNPEDVTKVSRSLKELGFVQGKYNFATDSIDCFSRQEIIYRRMNWGEVATFIRTNDCLELQFTEVDINISIDWLPSGRETIVNEMINNRTSYNIGNNITISSLSYEDFLIYLCMHLYKEAVLINMVEKLRDYDLYKYVDIYSYMHVFHDAMNWRRLADRIKEFSLCNECYYSLYFVFKIFKSLENDNDFINLLHHIEPKDKEYLGFVYDGSDETKLYKWKVPFEKRFLDSKRLKHLVRLN